MSMIETVGSNVHTGTRWKGRVNYPGNCDSNNNNLTFFVNRVTTRAIHFGTSPDRSNHEYSKRDFIDTMIRIDHPEAELLTQLTAIISQLKLKPATLHLMQEELVKQEI